MTVTTKEKDVNYTPEMVEAIKAAAPLNLEKAKAVGLAIGRSYRSVIAKAKSEKVEYVSKPAPAKKEKPETKSEIVGDISKMCGGLVLDGLDKAPAGALRNLREYHREFAES
jgi:hypothetical protein